MQTYILLLFFCISGEDGAACRSAVVPIWFPSLDACEDQKTARMSAVKITAARVGEKLYAVNSRCLPMDRVVLADPT